MKKPMGLRKRKENYRNYPIRFTIQMFGIIVFTIYTVFLQLLPQNVYKPTLLIENQSARNFHTHVNTFIYPITRYYFKKLLRNFEGSTGFEKPFL